MTNDLITAAQAAHAAYLAEQAQEKADTAIAEEESQADFLRGAAAHAVELLGSAAEGLPWISTPELAPHTYAATAALAPLRAHDVHLNLRLDAYTGVYSLALVRSCRSCTEQLTDQVESLTDLGRLLDDGQPHDEDGGENAADDQEPGPLAAVEQAEQRAASVAALVRRLLAQHPDGGLTVDTVAVFGQDDGAGSAQLRIKANRLDALRSIAAAMGQKVSTRVTGTHPGMVLEHGTVTFTSDDTEVQVRAYTQLPEDEAAAWLAQQNQDQAAEDTETTAGGVV